jgi:hypothetical protein
VDISECRLDWLDSKLCCCCTASAWLPSLSSGWGAFSTTTAAASGASSSTTVFMFCELGLLVGASFLLAGDELKLTALGFDLGALLNDHFVAPTFL